MPNRDGGCMYNVHHVDGDLCEFLVGVGKQTIKSKGNSMMSIEWIS